jgi:hypothetical protein
MTGTRFYIVVILLTICGTAQSQIARRRNGNWVSPKDLDEVYRIDNYEITERYCSNDQGSLCVFIRRDFDKEPIQFYAHHRGISVILGHREQLVLINDYFATKSGRVMVVNLNSGVNAEIDRRALAMYRRQVKPDQRLWIVPEAYEFSPDDKQVLMRMVEEDVSAATAQESIEASKTYKDWWYSVNSQTGRVIREYRTNRIPKKWW